jgi:colicin import membrane protein
MAELSSFTRKVLSELAPALASYTPENIKACAKAEAEALKLTEPERKARDEAVAKIEEAAAVSAKLTQEKAEHAESKRAAETATQVLAATTKEAERRIEQEDKRLADLKTELLDWQDTLKEDTKQLKADQGQLRADRLALANSIKAFEDIKKKAKLDSKAAIAQIDAA